jgi:hypothetical protein
LCGIVLGLHSGSKIGEWAQVLPTHCRAVIDALPRYRINTFLQIPEKFEAVSIFHTLDSKALTDTLALDCSAPGTNVGTSHRRPSAIHTVLHLGLGIPFVAAHHHGEGIRLACLGSRCSRNQLPLPHISPRLYRSWETYQGVYSHGFLQAMWGQSGSCRDLGGDELDGIR